jgi:hypothetical protein
MRGRHFASLLFCCIVAFGPAVLASQPTTITGSVIGEGTRPIEGATVQVVTTPSEPTCKTTTVADGTFSLSCTATGLHVVRASFGDLRPWEIGDVELGPGHEIHLNFMLLPESYTASAGGQGADAVETHGFWTRRVPNPTVASWQQRPITLRALSIAVAPISFVLGALTMMALGRRFGIETRRLSAGEVGDMVLNPSMPTVGERVTPIAVAGARGASATVSYGADEIAAALAARRYGLLFAALVVAPALFGLFSLAMALAMLIGQEMYLLCAMLLVPAGFLVTPIIIFIQAWRRVAAVS